MIYDSVYKHGIHIVATGSYRENNGAQSSTQRKVYKYIE